MKPAWDSHKRFWFTIVIGLILFIAWLGFATIIGTTTNHLPTQAQQADIAIVIHTNCIGWNASLEIEPGSLLEHDIALEELATHWYPSQIGNWNQYPTLRIISVRITFPDNSNLLLKKNFSRPSNCFTD